MRNDLPNTARRARIEERKGYKVAQNTPKGLVFASGHGTPLDAQNVVNRHYKPLLKGGPPPGPLPRPPA